MIAISNAQMRSFEVKAQDDFFERLVTYTREKFPRKFMRFGEAAMRRHIATAMKQAKACGFETERQIVSFLDLGLRCGRFYDADWAQASLNPDSGPADQRLRQLEANVYRATGRIR